MCGKSNMTIEDIEVILHISTINSRMALSSVDIPLGRKRQLCDYRNVMIAKRNEEVIFEQQASTV